MADAKGTIARSSVNRRDVPVPSLCVRYPEYKPLKRAAARKDVRPPPSHPR